MSPVCTNSEEMFLLLLYNLRAKPSASQWCRFKEEDPERTNWNFAYREFTLDFVLLPQRWCLVLLRNLRYLGKTH